MRVYPAILSLTLAMSQVTAADLAPNAKLAFEYPDLPNTLAGMVSGTEKLARLGAILPSNYSSETKHPLFVYLKGGSGGPDDEGEMARDIVMLTTSSRCRCRSSKRTSPRARPCR
jgi:hypothetical protein